MLRFIKDWTLPLAMLTGTIIYLAFASFDFLTPLRPAAKTATAQYWTLCLRKVLKAKFAATKGEKRVMRNSAVRCAHASN